MHGLITEHLLPPIFYQPIERVLCNSMQQGFNKTHELTTPDDRGHAKKIASACFHTLTRYLGNGLELSRTQSTNYLPVSFMASLDFSSSALIIASYSATASGDAPSVTLVDAGDSHPKDRTKVPSNRNEANLIFDIKDNSFLSGSEMEMGS
jgi:hypothetical protein